MMRLLVEQGIVVNNIRGFEVHPSGRRWVRVNLASKRELLKGMVDRLAGNLSRL